MESVRNREKKGREEKAESKGKDSMQNRGKLQSMKREEN